MNEFILKAQIIHQNKYDYSKVDYKNNHTKVIIICPIHGEFEQTPKSHLIGRTCPKCNRVNLSNKQSQKFINRANQIHNNKYNYSGMQYNKSTKRIKIICPIHGEFEQTPACHLGGRGCPECGKERALESVNSKKYNLKSFIDRANSVHHHKYDYSKTKYVGIKEKIIIICPTHGEFEQIPNDHLCGKGCKKCADDEHRLSTNEFIEKVKIVHGDRYDYIKVDYQHTMEKVEIICPRHGSFFQKPNNHIQGAGCPKCYGVIKLTNREFVERSNQIHNHKYNYSKSEYKGINEKVNIICPEHGLFRQSPKCHLDGCGCPKCNISSGHNLILNILGEEEIVINDRNIIGPYELDIYLPKHKLAIEYHGTYWHSYDRIESQSERESHSLKSDLCTGCGIQLLQILEHELNNKQKIVESVLRHKINKSNKVYARKCEIKQISSREHVEFMDANHIQGGKGCNVAYGLTHNNELISVMSFNRHHKYEWEITRFANKLNTTVVGGASKLFKKFLKETKPNRILTYADRRYSNGNLYRKLGFKLDGITKPNYCYVKNKKIYSRQQFQKHKLKNKLEVFNSDLTEVQNMFNNGYRRLWDAGHYRFIWEK